MQYKICISDRHAEVVSASVPLIKEPETSSGRQKHYLNYLSWNKEHLFLILELLILIKLNISRNGILKSVGNHRRYLA
jgi:hypothetical protein